MSLKIWLPLLGNLENQGASAVTATNNGATVDTAGKIGSCYSFDGVDDFLTLNNFNPNGWPEISISAWVYPTADFVALFLIRGGGQHRVRISTNGFMFRDTNNSGTQREIAFSPTIPVNMWTHITCVYKRGEIWIYQNGIQTAHSTAYYNTTSTLLSDMGEFRIGRQQSTSGNSYYTGKVNDFRIYDYALSAAEVHEISQGLILHYKLDGDNLFNYNTLTHDIYVLSNGNTSTSGAVGNWCLTDYIPVFPSTSYIGYNLVNGGNGNPSICFYDKNKTYTRGQTITANTPLSVMTTDTEYYVRISVRKANNDINKMLFIEIPTIIQDSSGYGHNGTITGNLSLSSNTPRYSNSVQINSDDAVINTIGLYTSENKFSFNIWANPSSLPTAAKYLNVRLNNTLFFNFGRTGTSGNKGQFLIFNGSNYKGPNGSFTFTTNAWHMWSGTYDGTTARLYKDGEEIASATSTTNYSLTITDKEQFLGTGTAAQLGLASDIRLYATALSADDIRQLYQVGAKVDNKQNLHIYEAVEMQSPIKLTKQGQMKAGEFQEDTATKLYETDQIIETNNLIEL